VGLTGRDNVDFFAVINPAERPPNELFAFVSVALQDGRDGHPARRMLQELIPNLPEWQRGDDGTSEDEMHIIRGIPAAPFGEARDFATAFVAWASPIVGEALAIVNQIRV
jgi:hypothetical protein